MSKFKVILSDLHLGAGGGNPLDDFCLDGVFADLLAQLAAESERDGVSVELIFAGDTFEFLQVPVLDDPLSFDATASYPPEAYAPSDEASAAAKMETILAGHPDFVAALRAFIQVKAPQRRLTFIKGNHDVELHWQAVQRLLRAQLQGTGEREPCLTFVERRISREGIYVEHGNQYAEPVSRLDDFQEPHDYEHPDQLALPVGSRFVYRFFNQIERERYWIDGVKPLTALIWYLLALDTRLALRALGALLREAPAIVLTAEEEVLLHDLQAGLYGTPETAEERGALFETVSRALGRLSLAAPAGERDVWAETRSPWGEAALSRGWAEERQQRSALATIAQHRQRQEHASVIVFGHTHAACQEALEDGATYLNAGTWTWVRDFSGQDAQTWRELFQHPERFMAIRRPTYVRVDYDAGDTPRAQLCELAVAMPRPTWWRRLLGWLSGRRN